MENEARYRTLVETIQNGIQEVDTSGVITFANGAYHRMLGYEDGELIGKVIWDLIEFEDASEKQAFRTYFKTLVKEQPAPTHYFHKNRTKDGRIIDTRVDWHYKRDEQGILTGLISVITDISEQKAAEESIKTLKQHMEFILGTTKTRFDIIDSKFTIRYIDPEWQKVYGDPTGKKCYEYFMDRTEVCPSCGIPKAMKTKSSVVAEEVLVKEGNRPIQVTTIPFQNSEGEWLFAEVNVDITERKKAEKEKQEMEAQLFQAQKMETVGRLAGGIAHDFNNLLQTINGYSNLILRHLGHGNPFREDIEEILDAGKEAAALADHLLALSRKQKTVIKPVNLNALIKNKEKMLQRLIGEDIRIVSNLSDRLCHIKADAGQIHLVIMNLAINARDAMPEGGTLTIATENVKPNPAHCKIVPGAQPGTFVRLSISDTGAGMEAPELTRIFEPFYTTKGPGEGTGLGLSTAYGIIHQHGGFITVSSEPGKGTTFSVYLPGFYRQHRGETRDSMLPKEVQGNGERILLVEDEKRVRKFATRVLREHGYIPFPASSGTEALSIFEKEDGRFDLVLSDVVLPDMRAPKLVDQLQARKPEVRVVLASGYTDEKSQMLLMRERGFRFLQKPYTISDMLCAIKEVIGSNR